MRLLGRTLALGVWCCLLCPLRAWSLLGRAPEPTRRPEGEPDGRGLWASVSRGIDAVVPSSYLPKLPFSLWGSSSRGAASEGPERRAPAGGSDGPTSRPSTAPAQERGTAPDPDPDFDLDFWPSSNASRTERPPPRTPKQDALAPDGRGRGRATTQALGAGRTDASNAASTVGPITRPEPALTAGPPKPAAATTPHVTMESHAVPMTTQPELTVAVATRPKPTVTVTTRPKPTVTATTRPKPTVTVTTRPKPTVTVATKPKPTGVTAALEPIGHTAQGAEETTATGAHSDRGLPEVEGGPLEQLPKVTSTRGGGDGRSGAGTVPNPAHTQTSRASTQSPGAVSDVERPDAEVVAATAAADEDWDGEGSLSAGTTAQPQSRGLPTEDWMFYPMASDASALPDCNAERSGVCSPTDAWAPTSPQGPGASNGSGAPGNRSDDPSPPGAPPPAMFVPLRSDWDSARATWGLAWEAHVYGLGAAFALVALASALNLLCLPLRCPSGCGYFALVSLFLLAAGGARAFALLYDAYGHGGRLASAAGALLLREAPLPCLTAAFGLLFLLLAMRSRMQLSYSAFQQPCVLAGLVLLHFAAALGPAALLRPDALVSRGAFAALASFLSAAYFAFYCYVRADAKHIYRLHNTSPTPAERYNRCPFAASREWERAAAAVLLAALLSLAAAALQLYAVLRALGLAGGAEALRPWPWWAFQLGCRACEAGACLTLALVAAQPVYCAERPPLAGGGCWAELLAAKSPRILPGGYQWTLAQPEKLAARDGLGRGETECLPLYALVDDRPGGSLNGLDLLYHSNHALAYRDLELPGAGASPAGSSCASDSTADLRPPSPINLRRSIDEALFREALFPTSLFGPLGAPGDGPDRGGTLPSDAGLYRTSSCVEVALPPLWDAPAPAPSPSSSSSSSSCCSSPERWRGSSSSSSLYRPSLAGSSLVLCSSPEGGRPPPSPLSGSASRNAHSGQQGASLQRRYRTLGSESQDSLELSSSEQEQAVQEEFISVCRQIDALSICSETIDL